MFSANTIKCDQETDRTSQSVKATNETRPNPPTQTGRTVLAANRTYIASQSPFAPTNNFPAVYHHNHHSRPDTAPNSEFPGAQSSRSTPDSSTYWRPSVPRTIQSLRNVSSFGDGFVCNNSTSWSGTRRNKAFVEEGIQMGRQLPELGPRILGDQMADQSAQPYSAKDTQSKAPIFGSSLVPVVPEMTSMRDPPITPFSQWSQSHPQSTFSQAPNPLRSNKKNQRTHVPQSQMASNAVESLPSNRRVAISIIREPFISFFRMKHNGCFPPGNTNEKRRSSASVWLRQQSKQVHEQFDQVRALAEKIGGMSDAEKQQTRASQREFESREPLIGFCARRNGTNALRQLRDTNERRTYAYEWLHCQSEAVMREFTSFSRQNSSAAGERQRWDFEEICDLAEEFRRRSKREDGVAGDNVRREARMFIAEGRHVQQLLDQGMEAGLPLLGFGTPGQDFELDFDWKADERRERYYDTADRIGFVDWDRALPDRRHKIPMQILVDTPSEFAAIRVEGWTSTLPDQWNNSHPTILSLSKDKKKALEDKLDHRLWYYGRYSDIFLSSVGALGSQSTSCLLHDDDPDVIEDEANLKRAVGRRLSAVASIAPFPTIENAIKRKRSRRQALKKKKKKSNVSGKM